MPKRPSEETGKKKNPAAVALSRLGASKGGKARAAKLSPQRRLEIARKAITARWSKES
jgi:ABC-type phosphate/phosphonate transport system ATPase subunit